MVPGGGAVGSLPMALASSPARAVSWAISPRRTFSRSPAVASSMVPFSNARVVALDGGFLLPDLGEDGAVFGAPVGVPVAVPLLGPGDGVCDEVAGVGVEVVERLE